MPARTEITEDEMREIVRMYEEGQTLREIARQMRLSQVPIRRVLRDKNVTVRSHADTTKMTRNQKVIEMCHSGMNYQQVADAVGLTRQRVHQIIARGY